MPKKRPTSGLSELIIDRCPALSKQERKIADFIVKSRPSTLVLTGKELSVRAGVSEATIVRFAKHLGFRGFPQMKALMIAEFKERIMPQDRFKFMSRGKNHASTVSRVAELEVENINDTVAKLDPRQVGEFIRRMHRARYTYTIGIGISALMARVAAYMFNQAGIRAFACPKEEHSFIERLIRLDRKDAVLALSFPPYSKETIDALKYCHQRGVSCLALTDKPTAPAVPWTHAHIVVRSDNMFFTNAVASLAMMLNALATELALLDKDKAAEDSKRIMAAAKDGYIL